MGLPAKDIEEIERRAFAGSSKGDDRLLRPIVTAYSQTGLRDEALRVLRSQRPDEVGPFEPLLIEHVRVGDEAGFREAAWLMRELGAVPTADTYGKLIAARCERGEHDRALRVCQSALAAGTAPPAEAVDSLLVGLTESGLTGSALDVATALRLRHGRMLDGNGRAAQMLLDSAAHADMPLEVLAVHKELSHHVPSATAEVPSERGGAVAVHDELLQRCVRAGNIPAAMALMRQLRSRRVDVGLAPLDELLVQLLEADEVNEALSLAEGRWPHPLLVAGAPSASGASAALTLDLRGLPEGAARLCYVRYFQFLANATPTQQLLTGSVGPSQGGERTADSVCQGQKSRDATLSVVLSDRRVALAIIAQAASLEPPIVLSIGSGAGTRAGNADRLDDDRDRIAQDDATQGAAHVLVRASNEDLARWARTCAENRLREKRRGGLAMAVAGTNALWALALLVYTATVGLPAGWT
jgi:hypothetical protein